MSLLSFLFKPKEISIISKKLVNGPLEGKIYRYLIVSDSHGLQDELRTLLDMYPNMDGYFHAGDSELDDEALASYQAVIGNHDLNTLPLEIEVQLGPLKGLLIHSHRQYGFRYEEKLLETGLKHGADIIIKGHTHIFEYKTLNDLIILNPGSLRHSRDDSSSSYAILEVDEHGNINFTRYKLANVADFMAWDKK